MIRVAHIMPTSYLSQLNVTASGKDVGMSLAHLILTDAQYKQHYSRLYKKYTVVILDNSAFELGAAMNDVDLIEAAESIQPDEIVLPDILFNADQTLSRIKQFLAKHIQDIQGLSLMAVPHGNTLDEYLDSYVAIAAMPEVTTIGIGTIYNEYFKQEEKLGREVIFDALITNNLLAPKPHHLLGLGDDGNLELARLSKFNFIRSCDSSAAYTNACNGVLITSDGYKKPPQRVNFEDVCDEKVLSLLRKNMAVIERSAA
jgi:hypothetical protein